MLKTIFADLHIHIGRDMYGHPVKISASPKLTITNILEESSRFKGIDLIGVVDCHAPNVLEEIEMLIDKERAKEIEGGGIRFEKVTLILGSEIEIYDDDSSGPFHVLVFLPTLEAMHKFSTWLRPRMTNINLSSQRIYCSAKQLQTKTKQLGGLFIPAHVFTPFKSLYGRGVNCSLVEVLDPSLIDAIELGLSSDTQMADSIEELHRFSYVTNSDSHSLKKIAREYQKLRVKEASFKELACALKNKKGREIVENYGMNPYLGKYYETVCQKCFTKVNEEIKRCPTCSSTKIIRGVKKRIEQLTTNITFKPKRPPYIYQVPLDYIPGLGPKTLDKLLTHFGTEMNIIHEVSEEELSEVVSKKVADWIIRLRKGTITFEAGGGGKYGRLIEK